jgi:GTPase
MFALSLGTRLFHGKGMAGLIAIVGRPNVGKSALFNRIAGKRVAIVHDEPGVTRDRISIEAEWRGSRFTLVDTGGIGLLRREKAEDAISQAAMRQVELAIESADVIILVTDVRQGIVPLDLEAAQRLRTSRKPVVVAVNKVDHDKVQGHVDEFSGLGFEKIFPVSAIHGLGIDLLMDAAVAWLPAQTPPITLGDEDVETDGRAGEARIEPAGPLKLAIIGRPNVGKSSLINALTKSERVIVTPIPGTTRDAVDVPFEVETDGVREHYVLIDTAGVRQERRVHDSIEFYSIRRTQDSIARCDIAVLVLDAEAGVSAQDKKVAGKIVDERKACIVIVNKWDLLEEGLATARQDEFARRQRAGGLHRRERRLTTLAEFGGWVQEQLFFLDYAPVIFTSAVSGFHLDRLLEAVRYVAAQLQQKVPTAILNQALQDAIEERQPVSAAGHRLKFFYATQVRQAPPTFLLFVNRDELFSDQYTKYLGNQLRRAFGFEGCPLILVPKPRPKTVESKRQRKPARQQGKQSPTRSKGKARAAKQRR